MAKRNPQSSELPAEAPTTPPGNEVADDPAVQLLTEFDDELVRPSEPVPVEQWDIEDICSRIANGERLNRIATSLGHSLMKLVMVLQREENREMYVTARKTSAYAADAEIQQALREVKLGLIDPQAARVFIDGHRWRAAKLNKDEFGEKQEIEQKHTINNAEAVKALSALPAPALPPMPAPPVEEGKPTHVH